MVKSLQPVRVQADCWWFFYRKGLLDRVRCVVPLPVLKNPKFTSTIGSYSLGNGVRARIARLIMRLEIPILHQALGYRRKRIYQQWGRAELVDVPFLEMPSRLGSVHVHDVRESEKSTRRPQEVSVQVEGADHGPTRQSPPERTGFSHWPSHEMATLP
jgi:hypothetical protein